MLGDGAMFTLRARSTSAVVYLQQREEWRSRHRVSFIQRYGSLCTADHIGDICARETKGFPAALPLSFRHRERDFVGIPACRGDANERGRVASVATAGCSAAS